jgi:glycosyltransferase involved in cell wall biosynthesis
MTRDISIALCTYNGERYLQELLDSVAEQKHLPSELVVCDDRSTDGTVAIVEAFAQRAPFPVKLNIGHRQRGPTENFEWAISLCEGDLISLCDQDDIWLPHKLSRAVDAFAERPEIGFSFSDAELVGPDLTPLGRTLWDAVGFKAAFRERASAGDLMPLLVQFTFVTGSTMVFRRDLREVLSPMPHNWHHDAWIALLGTFLRPYAFIDEPLMLYRTHSDQAVGVPEKAVTSRWEMRWRVAADPSQVDVHRQRRRTEAERFRKLAERFEADGRRYLAAAGLPVPPAAPAMLDELEERAKHSTVRGGLPDRRLKRLPLVLKELRTGRYGRFSAGLLSAAQDVLY